MTGLSSRRYDVLIVGAGPAGLAAAAAAGRHGARVGLIDAQPQVGGQIWRYAVGSGLPAPARRAFAALDPSRVEWLDSTEVKLAQPGWLLADGRHGALQLHYRALVLATGARELLLPFPGWTLPGVTGAGAAQALAKQGWPWRGRRVLVAGSGPLLLATAATLRGCGARILAIHEQATAQALAGLLWRLPRWPGKALQAATLRARLAGVTYRRGSVVLAAHGDQALREVEIDTGRGRERIACDQLALGYGLVPNIELARALGCRLERVDRQPRVTVDALLRTSVDGVFAAGEALGVGGRDCAVIEGAMAGHLAVGAESAARALDPARRRARAFAALLADTFALDRRIHTLAGEDTLICRCEDVTLGALRGLTDLRQARLATRCGMGACQGRICITALAELGLVGANHDSGCGRPPLLPTRLAALADSFTPDLQESHS